MITYTLFYCNTCLYIRRRSASFPHFPNPSFRAARPRVCVWAESHVIYATKSLLIHIYLVYSYIGTSSLQRSVTKLTSSRVSILEWLLRVGMYIYAVCTRLQPSTALLQLSHGPFVPRRTKPPPHHIICIISCRRVVDAVRTLLGGT